MFKGLKPILYGGREVWPLVEGGKGVSATNHMSSGAWAAAGGIGTVSAVNADSYLSVHNTRFSRPLTGDYEQDLLGNRTCRKFERPPELRAARNTEPLLLQTYLRDTGEILCDIAMPLSLRGRHWGNIRIGIPVDGLLGE